jgi:hypothetical protein
MIYSVEGGAISLAIARRPASFAPVLQAGLQHVYADLRHEVVVGDGEPVATRQGGCSEPHGFTIGPGRVQVNFADSPSFGAARVE